MISKRIINNRLLLESQDGNYDKEDRVRFKRLSKVISKIPNKSFNKVFLSNNTYEYYRGFCYAREISSLDETDFNIIISIIENIKTGFYK